MKKRKDLLKEIQQREYEWYINRQDYLKMLLLKEQKEQQVSQLNNRNVNIESIDSTDSENFESLDIIKDTAVCLSLDGVDGYVNIPHDDSLNVQNELSISCWLYPKNVSATSIPLAKRSTASSGWQIKISESKAKLEYRTASSNNITNTVTLTENEWHHLVFVVDGPNAEAKLYQDGVLRVTRTVPNENIISNTHPLTIGTDSNGNNHYFGFLDDIRVYNKALSDRNAQQLWNNGDGRWGWRRKAYNNSSTNVIQAPYFIGWWKCEEGSPSSKCFDSSNHVNNGTIVNQASSDSWENDTNG